MKDKQIIYYNDELNDDFAGSNIKVKQLTKNFKYTSKCWFFNFITFIFYRFIATPLVFLMVKIIYHQRFKNKKVLRQVKKGGYLLYGNHTNGMLDAYVPTLITFPRKAYIVVNPAATSIFGIRTIVMMLGAIPLPNGVDLYRKYLKTIDKRSKHNVVTIYPEAHIWPYYTDIRDFNPASLAYAYEFDKPVFCFANVYKKQKLFKRPRVITYIDGPFYINKNLNKKENIKILKEEVYGAMKKRIEGNPKYEYKYIYIKTDE